MIKSRFQGHILHVITSFTHQYFRGLFGAGKNFNTHMGVIGLIFFQENSDRGTYINCATVLC